MKPIDNQEWDDLLESVLNGTLDETRARRLNDILKSDSSRMDEYIRYIDLHGSLFRDSTLSSQGPGDYEPYNPQPARRGLPQALFFLSGIAATIAAIVVFNTSQTQPETTADFNEYPIESYIGIVTRLDGPSDGSLHVGRGIKLGRFRLEQGEAQLRLDNGVELSLRSPVQINFHGPDHISLLSGMATAQVPQQAIGFRIDTPDIEIVDLGTSFALNVDSTGRSTLHVIEGEVEARRHDEARAGTPPMLIARHNAEEDRERPPYLVPEYDPEAFAPRPFRDPLIAATGGMLQSLQETPADLRNTQFAHDYIMLFPERKNVVLTEDLPINLSEPGNYYVIVEERLEKNDIVTAGNQQLVATSTSQSTIPAGTVVSSYLVHFDANDLPGGFYRAKARIRFRDPILGVILNGEDLNATDSALGNPNTVYETHSGRQTESDLVRISSDRKQIFLNLGVSGLIDQVRVVLAADETPAEGDGSLRLATVP